MIFWTTVKTLLLSKYTTFFCLTYFTSIIVIKFQTAAQINVYVIKNLVVFSNFHKCIYKSLQHKFLTLKNYSLTHVIKMQNTFEA